MFAQYYIFYKGTDSYMVSPTERSLPFPSLMQSSNPPFTSVELDHSDSGREGCTVTTLTVTAEPQNWRSAIKVAVHEVCAFMAQLSCIYRFSWLYCVIQSMDQLSR
jgi:hypothetical protein